MATVNTGSFTARLNRREPDAATVEALVVTGYHEIAARVLAGRQGDNAPALGRLALSALSHPDALPDMTPAAAIIAQAVAGARPIALITDHDVDGVSAHAIMIGALVHSFGVSRHLIQSHIGLRLKDGYGVSDAVVDRVLANDVRPQVVITADCGSSDEPRIARLKQTGCQVIVTDHHELGFAENDNGDLVEMPPPSAAAVVNPARTDSAYGDRLICGAMVAWLTMCAVRTRLIADGCIGPDTPNLAYLLDYAALGTVADCVSLGESINNRAIVRYGLKLIEYTPRPCFRQAAGLFMGKEDDIGAQDLAFGLAPRINACGRLGDAMVGVDFLLSDSDSEAARLAHELDAINTKRKGIQDGLTEVALLEAEIACDRGDKGLALSLEDGHPGVHGIVASRVLERYARPVICLSPHAHNPDIITGSARAPAGVHIRDIFESIHRAHPGLLLKFGGHAGAGGLTLNRSRLDEFMAAFAQATASLDESLFVPVFDSDGAIDPALIDDDLMTALAGLEPYGRGFAVPTFEADFVVLKRRSVGADKTHLQLSLKSGQRLLKGIWFSAADDEGRMPVQCGETVRLLFEPNYNVFSGTRTIQLLVRGRVQGK